MTLKEFIDVTFRPEPEYISAKFEEYRSFTMAMFFLGGTTGLFLWLWDYVLDPVGAQHTVLLRHGIPLFMVSFCVSLFCGLKARYVPYVAVMSIWICEVLFTIILGRLSGGMVYGLGGYLYFVLLPLLMLQGLTFRINLLYDVGAVLIPHGLGLLHLAPGFEHGHYAIWVWPAFFVASIAQFANEMEYFQRYHLKRALYYSAHTDPLTGVSNRRYFMERSNEAVRRAKRLSETLAVLMMDIDFFKKINDRYGHPAGDEVIKALAKTVKQQIREIDLLGRLGGEEFAVLLVDTDLRNGKLVAERIRAAVEGECVVDSGRKIRFTVSVGVSVFQDDAEMDSLLQRADEGLYRAKKKGRNRVCSSTRTTDVDG